MLGGDSSSGWLPPGATIPLPSPPEPGLVDVQLAEEEDRFWIRWHAHDPAWSRTSSGRGERPFLSLASAEKAAEHLFGIAPDAWPFVAGAAALTAPDVQALLDLELAPYREAGVSLDEIEAQLLPPRQASFQAGADTFSLWVVGTVAGYVVFYDEERGDYGLGTADDGDVLTYLGNYGPFWATLLGA